MEKYDLVRLTQQFGELNKGMIGTIVMVYDNSNTTEYEIEFSDEHGKPITTELTITLSEEVIEKV